MSVLYGLFLCLISFSARAEFVEIICRNENTVLEIQVKPDSNQKEVLWIVRGHDRSILLQGRGQWTKEIESEDAFSSFDANSAIGFKRNRAVVLLNTDDVIVFNSCSTN